MQNTFIKSRIATNEDISQLISMGKELHEVEKKFEPLLEFNESEAIERYTSEVVNPKALLLIAEDQERNEIAGYLYAHYNNIDYFTDMVPECEIEVIYLKQDYRGIGIADMLIKESLDWAHKAGISRIKTGIYFSNISSRKLFERNRFKPYHISYILES